MMKKIILMIAFLVFCTAGFALAAPISLPSGQPLYFQFNNIEEVKTDLSNSLIVPGGYNGVNTQGNWGLVNVSTIQIGSPSVPHLDIAGGPVFWKDDGPGGTQGQITGIFYGIQLDTGTKAHGGTLDLYWHDAGSDPVTEDCLAGTTCSPDAAAVALFTGGTFLVRLNLAPGIITGDTVTTLQSSTDITVNLSGQADSFANVDTTVVGPWTDALDKDWFWPDPNGDGTFGGPGETRDVRFSNFFNGIIDIPGVFDSPWTDLSNDIQGFRSNDPARVYTIGPCIDLIKEVSNDGLTWHDANDPQCADAPGTLDPAYYRLTIKNCGPEELTNLVINDPVLGITNYAVGSNLPVGGPDIVLTSAQIAQLNNPDLCPLNLENPNLVNGGLRNIARVDAEGITSGIAVFDEDPACIKCVCIDLIKEVSNDGLTWHDANDPQCADAPGTLDPAYYRLTIKNCGTEELTNIVINDSVLGITNYAVGSNLPAGGTDIILTSADISQLANPNLCPLDPDNPNVVNGGLRNIARVDAEGVSSGIAVFDEDPACIKCGNCCLEIIKTATPVNLTCVEGLWWLTNRCKCCKTFGCIQKCCTVPKVKYTYKIKNLCDPVKNVKVVDVINGKPVTIKTFSYLGTGQEKIINITRCVCNTTINTATVKGYLVSDPGTFCTDSSDTITVTVTKPW